MPKRRRKRPHRALLPLAVIVVAALAVAWVRAGFGWPLTAPFATAAAVQLRGAAPGACLAYPPTAGDRHLTVFLDPGHGGLDPGTSGTTTSGAAVLEKTETLAVARQLAALLTARGYRVVLSRATDTTVAALAPSDLAGGALTSSFEVRDLNERAACANASGAAALLSIHFNGFDDPAVGGSETFYDPDRSFAGRSQSLAAALQAALVRNLGLEDRGVSTDTSLDTGTLTGEGASYGHLILLGPAQAGFVTSPSGMPGALTEPLFLTDPQDASLVAGRPDRVASALAEGLEAYLKKRP